ncbi:MAG: SBBP repeat-containing protein [Flavobacteriales bacterium]
MKTFITFLFSILIATPLLFAQPVRSWGTYYGGTGQETANSVAVDGEGNVYIAGFTTSTTAISIGGTHQPEYGGGSRDAYLAKFNSAGVRLWSTYYGGATEDEAYAVCVDANGYVYIAGSTDSWVGIASNGSHQPSLGGAGSYDAFVAKFNGTTGVRQWGTYYGGVPGDEGRAVAVDANGNVYLTGATGSASGISTPGSHQPVLSGSDAFLVKFDSAGVRQWGTYYGGIGNEDGNGIAIGSDGSVYLGGRGNSPAGISTVGSHQPSNGGGTYDAFLAKFTDAGVRQWATYYGGLADDNCQGIAIDSMDRIYLAGYTRSTNAISTAGAHQESYGGEFNDAILVQFDADGVRQWGTYYGGLLSERGYIAAVDGDNNVYLSGYTSSENGISTPGSHQEIFGGGQSDGFLAKFNPAGARQWGTYYGGPGIEYGQATAVDANGSAYLVGDCASLGMSTPGSHQPTFGGGSNDAYVVRFEGCSVAPEQPAAINGLLAVCAGSTHTYGVAPVAGAGSYTWVLPAGWTGTSAADSITVTAGAAGGSISVSAVNGCGASLAQTLTVAVNPLPTVVYEEEQTVYCYYGPAFVLTPGSPAGGMYSGPGVSGNMFTPDLDLLGTQTIVYSFTDGNGCSAADSSMIQIDICAGIADPVATGAGIAIFPNPTNGILTITTGHILGIRLVDGSGKLVLDQRSSGVGGSSSIEMDLGSNAPGIYMLQVTTLGAVLTQRISIL